MPVFALVWGIVSFVVFGLALIPCLGWLNWLNIGMSIVGVIIAIVALAKAEGQKTGMAVGGLVLCVVAILGGIIRLILGGGIL
jgi:hypothetical protein